MSVQDEPASQSRCAVTSVMGKRKRSNSKDRETKYRMLHDTSLQSTDVSGTRSSFSIQVIIGSYERVLYGITATLSLEPAYPITFTNTFLFNAHTSSIRCLAVSPPSGSASPNGTKRILATGSSDERINLYQISSTAPMLNATSTASALLATPAEFSSQPFLTSGVHINRELGSLLHHNSAISALYFPSRSKLLSASLDNNIAITRVRDWTVLSTIHAPIPKPAGRPTGDTAGPGEVPAGINAVAIHPSTKICLSVGLGERCMRLWNLVTGKKAGVLTFDKNTLACLGESHWRGGEGRQAVWSDDGGEFAIGFERGVLIYSLDCVVKGLIKLPGSKLCQLKYLPRTIETTGNVIVLATDDGRMLLYDTNVTVAFRQTTKKDGTTKSPHNISVIGSSLPLLATLGPNVPGPRIKDFDIHTLTRSVSEGINVPQNLEKNTGRRSETSEAYVVIAGSSDGLIRIYLVKASDIQRSLQSVINQTGDVSRLSPTEDQSLEKTRSLHDAARATEIKSDNHETKHHNIESVGILLGTFESGQRITCLTSFVMDDAEQAEGVHGAASDAAPDDNVDRITAERGRRANGIK